MKVRVVSTLREFEALAPVWHDLVAESGQSSVFAGHDWYACCWRTAGAGRGRELWMVEDAAGPVLMLPLVRARTRRHGLPVRELSLLSAPGIQVSEVPATGAVGEALRTLLGALAERGNWDVLRLDCLADQASVLKPLEHALPAPWSHRLGASVATPYLIVCDSWERFLGRQPREHQLTLERLQARFQDQGDVEVVEYRTPATVGPELQALALGLGETGSLGISPSRFLRELVHRAGPLGWLRLWTLNRAGKPVAAECQILDQNRLHTVWATLDAGAAASTPGAWLHAQIVRALHLHGGVREYHFGAAPSECRLGWADGLRRTTTFELYAPTLYGRLLYRLAGRSARAAQRNSDGGVPHRSSAGEVPR
jgi:CelD/BcsL family acetyltransferase involved in cellulose biosynthesis